MLVVTPGEPGGIGPDLVCLLAAESRQMPLVVAGSRQLLADRARALNLKIELSPWERPTDQVETAPGRMSVLDVPIDGSSQPGQLDKNNVPGVLASLDRAIDGCLNGEFTGLITGPMQKSVVNDAGVPFSGHTEYLQQQIFAWVL